MVAPLVVPPVETTVVPAGMPTPEMIWPAATPAGFDTAVMVVLPEVRVPTRFDADVMDALPEVTRPVSVKLPVMLRVVTAVTALVPEPVTEVMVAGFDITMVVPVDDMMLAPAGMPAPEMMRPGTTPVRLDTPVMDVLPEVTRPVVV